MRRFAALCSAALVVAVACGGSSDSLGLTGTANSGTGSMTATIDGQAFASIPDAQYSSNVLRVAGLDMGLKASISITIVATGPGTYTLTSSNQFGLTGGVIKGSQVWSTTSQGGTCTLILTTLTATHAVGTFSFDAPPLLSGTTGTEHVTNGKFDVTF